MSLVQFQRCESTEPWTSVVVPSKSDPGNKIWTVSVPWPTDGVDDLVCECPGYVFRGWCRHQEEAFDVLCRWDERTGPEEQSKEEHKEHRCPRCGKETIADMEIE